MNILPGDILVRNYKDGQTIWLSHRLVIQNCQLTDEYLRKMRTTYKKSSQKGYKYGDFLPKTGLAWRWGKVNGSFYYDYDCLPDRKPTYYKSKLGTKQQLLDLHSQLPKDTFNTKNIINQVKALIDNTDIRYYMYECLVSFNSTQATEMATAKAWCIFIKNQLQNDNFKKLGFQKIKDFYQACTEMITPLDLEGFKISNAIYLRNKIADFPASISDQRNYFINGRYGNDNAQIVGKYPLVDESTGQVFNFDIHQAMMFHLYMNPGDSTKEYIHSLHQYYVEDIKEFDTTPVAYRTFCHHLTRFNRQIQLARARHGVEYYKKHVQTYVTAERLQYAHSLFTGDGSGTINYKYIKPDGKLASMKLYVIIIADVASRYIAGFSVAPKGSHKETHFMTRDALKMTVEKCNKQTMFEFVSDNHAAFTSAESKELLNLAFNKVRTIEAGNSQSNPSETQFRLFKRSLKDIKNLLSTSWSTGLEGQANPDHININELPKYEDAVLPVPA